MILLITIVFFILVLMLPAFWGFGLSFFFQSIYFQNGNMDISSFGFLIVLLKLIISKKIDLPKLVREFNSIRLFIFILVVNILWSISWGLNAKEFILGNVRILIIIVTFSHFINAERKIVSWIFIVLLSFGLFALHNYLLSNELHPFYETLLEYGRLSARTITGEMLNSNQAAFTLFALFVIFFVLGRYGKEDKFLAWKWLISVIAIIVLIISGSLASRSVIFSMLLFIPVLYVDLKWAIGFALVFFIFVNVIDFHSVEVPFIGQTATDRMRDIQKEEISMDSEMSRAIIFSSGIKIFFDNFIFGIGTGEILETMSQSKYLGEPMMLHNVYLDFAIQFGLIGIFISLWIIYLGIKITQANLNLGFIYFVTIVFPNFGHDFFQINLTPILIVLLEFYSHKLNVINEN